jgi:hypothetical protein
MSIDGLQPESLLKLLHAFLQIGVWPRSRGLYGVDVMFTAPSGDEPPQPQVLEVNFAGDLSSILQQDAKFVDTVFAVLFANDWEDQSFEMLTRL